TKADDAGAAATAITVNGHGFGHGRGLGQFGALGYAQAPFNWSSAQILQHFYSNTFAGSAPGGPLTVVLSAPGATTTTGMTGATIVRLENGFPLVAVDNAAATPAPDHAVRIQRTGPSTYQLSYGPDCAGPWTTPPVEVAAQTRIAVVPAVSAPNPALADSLQVCDGAMVGGNPSDRRWVRGHIEARPRAIPAPPPPPAVAPPPPQYTVNIVGLDDYLRGVVPRESPASWPAAALQAQAVAARSYALADAQSRTSIYPWVATCDTISCQVYGGRRQARGTAVATEQASTDAAVAATAGQVRVVNGTTGPARTEFSSSTGGWSAGGTFPAVEDLGDATSSNSRHNWTLSVERSAVEAKYAMGAVSTIEVTRRNGLGADGGRVLQVTIRFADGRTLQPTGNEFRRDFGLYSDWFSLVIPASRFCDTAGSTHEAAIEALADAGVVRGSTNGCFRPDDNVTRGEMSAFLTRAYALTGTHPGFCDTAGHAFEIEIEAVAAAGITLGSNGCFLPNNPATRAQAAAFLARAEQLSVVGPGFRDTAGHTLETQIRQAAAAGIAAGDTQGFFRPDNFVTRGQAASFIARALDLI
nr:SpoIID/LytB domain-containing protein [Acidimicrobiia bacterium]